jgi:hypothetical protein
MTLICTSIQSTPPSNILQQFFLKLLNLEALLVLYKLSLEASLTFKCTFCPSKYSSFKIALYHEML